MTFLTYYLRKFTCTKWSLIHLRKAGGQHASRYSCSVRRTSTRGWGSSASGTRGATQRKHMVPCSCPTVWIQLPRKVPSAFGSACETISVKHAGSPGHGVRGLGLSARVTKG